jgi:CheY-like chemotaxis protein
MPDGEEVGVQLLRKFSKHSHPAEIVMLTAISRKSVMDECRSFGVKKYITKPFDDEEVLAVLEEYLN